LTPTKGVSTLKEKVRVVLLTTIALTQIVKNYTKRNENTNARNVGMG
jgi:hypothetical protein